MKIFFKNVIYKKIIEKISSKTKQISMLGKIITDSLLRHHKF